MSLLQGNNELTCSTTYTYAHISFDNLIRDYQPYITRLAFRLTGWQESDVEDLVQEIFLKVYKNLHRFQDNSHIKTWLTSIAINTCRSWRRKRIFRMNFRYAPLNPDALQAEKGCPSEALIEEERLHQINRIMKQLPAKLREVMVLRYLEEMEIDDIAHVLGITANAVHVRLNRSRKRLQENLSNTLQGE